MSFNKTLHKLYIQTYGWNQRKNRFIKTRKSDLCEVCNINKGIEVHHQSYYNVDYDNPGMEEDGDLMYVCYSCHNDIHTLATGKHSSKQSDMDEGRKKLKLIIDEKRKKYQEQIDKEKENSRLEYKRKQEKIIIEKRENNIAYIFFLFFFSIYFVLFKNHIYPIFNNLFDSFLIIIFIIGFSFFALLLMPFAFLIGYFRNKNK